MPGLGASIHTMRNTGPATHVAGSTLARPEIVVERTIETMGRISPMRVLAARGGGYRTALHADGTLYTLSNGHPLADAERSQEMRSETATGAEEGT